MPADSRPGLPVLAAGPRSAMSTTVGESAVGAVAEDC